MRVIGEGEGDGVGDRMRVRQGEGVGEDSLWAGLLTCSLTS